MQRIWDENEWRSRVEKSWDMGEKCGGSPGMNGASTNVEQIRV